MPPSPALDPNLRAKPTTGLSAGPTAGTPVPTRQHMSRRGFFARGAMALGSIATGATGVTGASGLLQLGRPREAHAFAGRDRLTLAQVQYAAPDQGSLPRPDALRRLAWELEKRTAIAVAQEAPMVRLSDVAELHRHPLLYWAGDRAFALPGDEDLNRLRRHLTMGGMLLLDSAEGRAGGAFDQSVRLLLARLFPHSPLTRLSDEHVLFRSFYLLRVPAGRVLALPYLESVIVGGRAAVVYAQNDLGGAWARDRFGQWQYEVVPGGESQREHAFRLGVNLAMYALCLDYKADQVHVPFIMRRRMWQVPLPQINTPSMPHAPAAPGGVPAGPDTLPGVPSGLPRTP